MDNGCDPWEIVRYDVVQSARCATSFIDVGVVEIPIIASRTLLPEGPEAAARSHPAKSAAGSASPSGAGVPALNS